MAESGNTIAKGFAPPEVIDITFADAVLAAPNVIVGASICREPLLATVLLLPVPVTTEPLKERKDTLHVGPPS